MLAESFNPADVDRFKIQIGRQNGDLDNLLLRSSSSNYTDVSGQDLTDEDMATVIRLGIFGKECNYLFLWNNQFTARSMPLLTEALRQCPTLSLRALDLSKNQIGDRGLKILLNAFTERHDQIIEINLSENGITDEGIDALQRKLPEIASLQSLLLNKNRIGNRGLVALGEFLASEANKLIEFCIDENDEIDDDGIETFLRKIQRKQNLKTSIFIRQNRRAPSTIHVLATEINGKNEKMTIFI